MYLISVPRRCIFAALGVLEICYLSCIPRSLALFPLFSLFLLHQNTTQTFPVSFAQLTSTGISHSLKESDCDLGLCSLLESSLYAAYVIFSLKEKTVKSEVLRTVGMLFMRGELVPTMKKKGSITSVAPHCNLVNNSGEVTAEPLSYQF